MKQFFITGTDTEVGKTHVTSLLMKLAKQHKQKVVGFKPIASGCEEAFGNLVNTDALSLIESGNINVTYEDVNPFAFAKAIAPHIAAKEEGMTLGVAKLMPHYHAICEKDADLLFIEGAGGWRVPLNDTEYFSDFAKATHAGVILVVGMRLGCINHALLTLEALKADGVPVVGWVANFVDPDMDAQQDNLESLIARMTVPILAKAPYTEGVPKLQVYPSLLKAYGLGHHLNN